ncbi:MAG: hypothetical protein C4518_16530 [Desulfobacteraceae bacterium]|nr:MAG: hypothetical protein C4518_16530 [Desulfobacteraceae bacterium]
MTNRKTKMMPWVLCFVGIFLCIPLTAMAKTEAPPAPVNASDFIKGLDVVGDLQLRYEYQDTDKSGDEALDRMRVRFRMGMIWDNADENWKVAAGLCTGGSDANSTSFTYSNEKTFETGDIRLDYAYAEHKLAQFKILAGQQKNLFATSWALWDSDVRPAGFTGTMDLKPVFITAGVYQARYIDKDIARMEAVQAGMKNDMLTAAVGFYNYHRIDEYVSTDTMDDDYTYQIGDVYVSGNIEAGAAALTPYAQMFYNFGAEGEAGQSILGSGLDPEDENLGYVVGVDAKIDRIKFGVAWAQIGADSVMQDLKDSSFGNGLGSTDTEGFKLNLGYALTKHFSITGTAYLYEAMERDLDQDVQLYQLDLDYKF